MVSGIGGQALLRVGECATGRVELEERFAHISAASSGDEPAERAGSFRSLSRNGSAPASGALRARSTAHTQTHDEQCPQRHPTHRHRSGYNTEHQIQVSWRGEASPSRHGQARVEHGRCSRQLQVGGAGRRSRPRTYTMHRTQPSALTQAAGVCTRNDCRAGPW